MFGGTVGISLNLSETWRPKEKLRLDAYKDHAKLYIYYTYWFVFDMNQLILHPWTPHVVAQQAVIGDCYKKISCNIFSPLLRPPWTQLPNLQRKVMETCAVGRGQVHNWILLVSWIPKNFGILVRMCIFEKDGNATWKMIHISVMWLNRKNWSTFHMHKIPQL